MTLEGTEYFYDEWLQLVTSVVGRGPVLDVGTPGRFRKELSVLSNCAATPYFCLDVVPGEVDLVSDAHSLPFRDRAFAGILCSHVLEHVARPDLVIDECHRVLKPGGRAYFTFLDTHPYHGGTTYRDFHRFKEDAVDLLLRDWSGIHVVQGGGWAHVACEHVPPRARRRLIRLANLLDRRLKTRTTTARYVLATR